MDKFCRNCGSPLNGQASFCSRCGTPVSTASAGMEYGHPNNSGSGPAPASGSNASNTGSLIGALITGAIMVGLAYLPYAEMGPVSLALKDSSDVWIYYICVVVIAVAEMLDNSVLEGIGGVASVLFNLYEIGDAKNTLGVFSEALDLSWGFWLIMLFSAGAVLSLIGAVLGAKKGQ